MINYHKYSTFYNYLVSDWTKKFEPYQEVKLFLTDTNDATVFEPKNKYFISYSANSSHFINAVADNIPSLRKQENIHCENTLLNKEIFCDSDATGDYEPAGSYEQMFDEPASAHASECPFIDSYKTKARNEALATGSGEISDEEATKRCFPWKSQFDEDEYYKFSIPLTDLNQSTVCLTASDITVSAMEKFEAKGALLTVKVGDNLFPIDFMYWTNPDYFNQYVFDWNPNGIIRVK